MTRSIVISGPPAVGKTTVARGLAEVFGMGYLSGGDILKEMAREEGFDPNGNDWWDTAEGMAFLGRRERNPEFDRRLDENLTGLFMGGGVVITSYTLPWLVRGGVKIWLAGSHESSNQEDAVPGQHGSGGGIRGDPGQIRQEQGAVQKDVRS